MNDVRRVARSRSNGIATGRDRQRLYAAVPPPNTSASARSKTTPKMSCARRHLEHRPALGAELFENQVRAHWNEVRDPHSGHDRELEISEECKRVPMSSDVDRDAIGAGNTDVRPEPTLQDACVCGHDQSIARKLVDVDRAHHRAAELATLRKHQPPSRWLRIAPGVTSLLRTPGACTSRSPVSWSCAWRVRSRSHRPGLGADRMGDISPPAVVGLPQHRRRADRQALGRRARLPNLADRRPQPPARAQFATS